MSAGIALPPIEAVLDAYEREMAVTGGAAGLRDEGGLRSALARADNRIAYAADTPSVHELAATIAFGIARNHPFVDGNKRMAFICAYVTLRINGWYLDAPEREATGTVLALAEGVLDEAGFREWLERWSYRLEDAP
ncbi:MAG: type II toxin-antitoxin system death-on-curing family toxin [Oceanicaulis sp.]